MARKTAAAAGAALCLMIGVPATVSAHGTAPDDAHQAAAIGDGAAKAGNGLWRVKLADGEVLTTHGIDEPASHGTDMGPGDPERAPVCADTNAQMVLYGYPVKGANRIAEVKSQIQAAIRRMDAVLNEEAVESGNRSADYRIVCEQSGQIAVGTFAHRGTVSFGAIVQSARKAGFKATDVDYTIFYDGDLSGVCGTGTYRDDDRPTADNLNNQGGGYGVTYVSCWDRRTPMHENGHNQGAVQTEAPDSTGTGHHCNDLYDVMCYAPDGGDRNQSEVTNCLSSMHFDCDHDTYFDVAPESGEWLENHWNLGSEANKFIVLGPKPTGGIVLPLLP